MLCRQSEKYRAVLNNYLENTQAILCDPLIAAFEKSYLRTPRRQKAKAGFNYSVCFSL
jgi:hypothetical protein